MLANIVATYRKQGFLEKKWFNRVETFDEVFYPVGKFLGDDGETGCEESGVAHRLDGP